jgi:two-component sensor histidine kinase/PAS domain-containing protein
MRQAIETHDWSGTSLGPRAQWPQSLRTVVDLMMDSGFAMCAGWGPDLVMIYNDAYAPILGKRHPAALGKTWAEAWPDVWDEIGPLIDRVMAGESVQFDDMHLVMTRNGYDEDTWWTFAYSPLRDESGAIVGFLDVVSDSTERVRQQARLAMESDRLRESEQRFRALVDASSDVVYRMSADWQEMRQLDGRGFLTDIDSPTIRWIDEYVPEEDRPEVMARIDEAIRTTKVFEHEHRVKQADGRIGWTLSRAIPVFDPDGAVSEWFGMAADVTERRRTDEHLRLVINELNHRVKNNLAMVQAMAMQTFGRADDLDEAIERFSGRLVALAQANDLLTGERWAGVDLQEVLRNAVRSHHEGEHGLRIDGPPTRLSPKSALALTLAAHELATNAVKYGAWSVPQGVVSIGWSIAPRDDGDRALSLEWRETGGPPVAPPASRGFGSRLIERGLSVELHGQAKLDFAPDGLVCRIEAVLPPEEGA